MSTGCERMTGTTPTFPTRPSDKPPIGTPNDPLGTSANVSRAQKTAREWKWQELEGPLEWHVETAVFSPDGSLVAAGAGDTICVWAAENGKQISRMKLPETQIYHRLVFSADGKTLVSDCREDRMIRFWDVRTGKQKRELAHVGGDSSPSNFSSRWMAFAPDGSVMALNGPSGTAGYGVHLLDLETGR